MGVEMDAEAIELARLANEIIAEQNAAIKEFFRGELKKVDGSSLTDDELDALITDFWATTTDEIVAFNDAYENDWRYRWKYRLQLWGSIVLSQITKFMEWRKS